jgi:hypothetical protein
MLPHVLLDPQPCAPQRRPSAKPRSFKPPARKRRGDEGETVPAEPDKPRPLSGGAAAELEFDD